MLAASYAQSTTRIPQFSNHQVNVWKTIIYPSASKRLTLHRHDYDRIVVALSNGLLKVTNQKGQTHYLRLKKNQAYYLTRDPLHEWHYDENVTKQPITVMVIELKETTLKEKG